MDGRWPDNARVAVALSWDVDGESALYVRAPERARNQLSELHQRLYGPQVGLYRVLALLDRWGVPGTFYMPGYTARLHPEAVSAIKAAGHPLGLHGYLHESLDTLSREQEEAVLQRAQNILGDLLGAVPDFYRAPSWELNRWSPEVLVRGGVTSDSSLMDDESPYVLQTPAGDLIEVPIHWILDDAEHWNHSRANRDKAIADPDTVFRLWAGEFDGYYDSGGAYVLTLHPFISGRSSHLQVVERLIRHIKSYPGVYWTTVPGIAEWARSMPDLARRTSPAPVPMEEA